MRGVGLAGEVESCVRVRVFVRVLSICANVLTFFFFLSSCTMCTYVRQVSLGPEFIHGKHRCLIYDEMANLGCTFQEVAWPDWMWDEAQVRIIIINIFIHPNPHILPLITL